MKTDETRNWPAFWAMVCIGVFLALIYLATPWRQDTSALWPVVKNTLVPTILAGWIVFATNAYKLRTTAFASAAAVLFVVIPTNIFVAYDLITYDGAGQTGFLIVLSIPLIFGLMAAAGVFLLGVFISCLMKLLNKPSS